MKKVIEVVLENDTSVVFGSVNEVVRELNNLDKKYPNHFDFEIRPDGGWDDRWVNIVAKRYETDEEYEQRIKKNEEQRIRLEKRLRDKAEKQMKELARNEEIEREMYLKLKQKYEN